MSRLNNTLSLLHPGLQKPIHFPRQTEIRNVFTMRHRIGQSNHIRCEIATETLPFVNE